MRNLLIHGPLIHSKSGQQSGHFLIRAGIDWDRVYQNNKRPMLKTLRLWLVCDFNGKIYMSEGYSGEYGFDF